MDIAKALSVPTGNAAKEDATKRFEELKAKAKAEFEEARKQEVDRLTTVDAVLPLEEACRQAGEGLDAYHQKRLTGIELAAWNAKKEPDVRKVVDACKTGNNAKVGACQGHALTEAPITSFGLGGEQRLLDACTTRHGAEVARAGI